jgi:dolichol-phosphate mannosyltransferase
MMQIAQLDADVVLGPPTVPWPPIVGVVVPTYREVENIPFLVDRLHDIREQTGWKIKLLFMDDNSKDGSEELIRAMDLPWVKMIVRTTDRGLSQAVLEGLHRLSADVLVVMDADLSHPTEKIPELVQALENGADFAVASRFAEGGSTDDDWGIFRWLNSRVATLVALPLSPLKDPMSGFFALRRSTFLSGRDFNPIGYKIGLELLIKCRCIRPVEIPIHFSNRRFGESKLSLREQLRYLQHVRRLYIYKFGNWSHLAQFLVVGASGLAVNLLLLTAFVAAGVARTAAVAAAIFLSMVWNFALNRRFTFSYARREPILKQFVGYVSTSAVGAVVNYLVTMWLWDSFHYNQIAAAIGVVAGTAFNFAGSRYVIFRKKHFKSNKRMPT